MQHVECSVTTGRDLGVLRVRFRAVTAFGVNTAACWLVTPCLFSICYLQMYMTSHRIKVNLLQMFPLQWREGTDVGRNHTGLADSKHRAVCPLVIFVQQISVPVSVGRTVLAVVMVSSWCTHVFWTCRVCISDVWIICCRHGIFVGFPSPSWISHQSAPHDIASGAPCLQRFRFIRHCNLFHLEIVEYLLVNWLAGCETANRLYCLSCLLLSRMWNSQQTLLFVLFTG